ncbi:MAG: hypothetical protein IPL43_00935 [Micropruina sp.]|nr:hypothetical protein [Micropruina sp.]
MRFTDDIHKVAVIIGSVALGPLLGLLMLVALFGDTGITTAVAEFSTAAWLVGTVVLCARTFRLSTEAPGSPRPW